MTIHKSKGTEFDAVVIVEGYRGVALLKEDEAPKLETAAAFCGWASPERGMRFASSARPMSHRSLIQSDAAEA